MSATTTTDLGEIETSGLLLQDFVLANRYAVQVREAQQQGGGLDSDAVVDAGDAWLDTRLALVRAGIDPSEYGLVALDEDMQTALDEMVADYARADG